MSSALSGSNSKAIAAGVLSVDIDVVNRWSQKEKSGGLRPALGMRQYYADVPLLLDSFLRYTQAM